MNTFQEWCKELLPIVQAGANGEEIEYSLSEGVWYNFKNAEPDLLSFEIGEDYRIKPKTITVNGIEVPEPIRKEPTKGDTLYFIPVLSSPSFYAQVYWNGDETDHHRLKHGLLHHTKEAAIAHAKAMLGIKE